MRISTSPTWPALSFLALLPFLAAGSSLTLGCSKSSSDNSSNEGAGAGNNPQASGGSGNATGSGGTSSGGSNPGGSSSTSGGSGGTTVIPAGGATSANTFDHTAAIRFDELTAADIPAIKNELRVFYGRLSHGDQVLNGLDMIAGQQGDEWAYDSAFLQEFDSSLDPRPNYDNWETATREQLGAADNDRNVVLWAWSSWLGRPEEIDAAFVDNYLAQMEQLEADFPDVTFIYATGPAQTYEDPDRNMQARNEQIRNYAQTHGKLLFDVESIELTDPDGNYYPDGTDACEWCSVWCDSHDCAPATPTGCSECSELCGACETNHTHCFNCYRKGRAFWWMLSQLVE